jgi:hypothetical protein
MSTTSRQTKRRLRRLYSQGVLEPLDRPVRRRWPGFLLLLAATLGSLWVLPWLAALAPVRDWILDWATADLPARVTCDTLSLGWLSPVGVRDLEIRDEEGELILALPRVTGDRPLWQLALDQSRLGKFVLERPRIALVLDEESSNLERALGLDRESEEPSLLSNVGLTVEVIDGRLEITDATTNGQWDVDDLQLACRLSGNERDPVEGSASGRVASGRDKGTFDAKFELESLAAQTGLLSVQTEGFPLQVLEPLLRRSVGDSQLAGRLDSQLNCEWSMRDEVLERNIEGSVRSTDLVLAGPWLSRDVLRLAQVEMPLRAVWQGDQLTVEEAGLTCDFGNVSYAGSINVADGLVHALSHGSYELQGKLDLAGLAAALPNTIRVREGTEIAAGNLLVSLSAAPQDGRPGWQGSIDASNLVAFDQGKQITWEKPIRVTFAGRDDEEGLVIDQLRCDSTFLELEASGNAQWLSVSASYDLDRLTQELDRFLDLGEVELAGQGWSHVTWKRGARDAFAAEGEMQVQNLRVTWPGTRPLVERQMVLHGEVAGLFAEREVRQVDSALFELKSGADRVQLELVRPVREPSRDQVWPVALAVDSQLAGWLPRLEALLGPMPEYELAGQCRATIDGTYSTDRVDVESALVQLTDFDARMPGVSIREPEANLSTSLVWTKSAGQAEIPKLVWKSPGLSVDVRDGEYRAATERSAATMAGRIAFAGDLARWQQWYADPNEPSTYRLAGRVAGEARLDRQGETTQAQLNAAIEQLVFAAQQGEPWREAHVQIVGTGQLDERRDQMTIDKLELASNAARMLATGSVAEFSGQRELALEGQLDYDLAQLQSVVSRWFGEGVRATGRDSRQFVVRGPLRPTDERGIEVAAADDAWLRELTGQGGAGWQWADVYGFVIGPGAIEGQLRDGIVRINPLNLAVSEGKLVAAPQIRVAPGPLEMRLPKGPLLEQVRITPQMCDHALQYVAPVLAGVADAEGTFSVELDDCRVPLADPYTADISGRFKVHSVAIGAGPLVRELAVLFNRATSVQLQQESTVAFRMVQGRIHHKDLELVFPDVTIRTRGSVGLDRTLALVAEMPVPKKWIGNNLLGDALKNQTIELPIGGTLDQPKIDPRALQETSARILQQSAGNLLRNELENQIQKLPGTLQKFLKPEGQ